MLGPNQLLDKIMEYGKNQFEKGHLNINKADLWKYIIKVDPSARRESLNEVIRELDARGWLLENDETQIKFDPAAFQ